MGLTADVVRSTGQFSRVVCFGDIHGDLSALKACLQAASLVDNNWKWVANSGTLLMSLGDVLGRGSEDWRCLKMLRLLKDKARLDGSDVGMVLGNHELTSMLLGSPCLERNDLLYSSIHPDAMRDIKSDCYPNLDDDAKVARERAFSSGGPASLLLSELCGDEPLVKRLGDNVFVHSALSAFEEDAMNSKMSAWLRGDPQASFLLSCGDWYKLDRFLCSRLYRTRQGAGEATEDSSFSRVIVGHNIQPTINSFELPCYSSQEHSKRVYRIDTGMSRFLFDGPKQSLELIQGQSPQVIGKLHD